ncbi:hypothetical protein MAR_017745 [Mya arenaria]|uniref:Uncharacterized protein n=1 Tax=Mya arenaria TaxID=6604 RepID=A0ABY7EFT8_MYAAR|nr:hypothetical protein MAR_017745 [Mya arenaria]
MVKLSVHTMLFYSVFGLYTINRSSKQKRTSITSACSCCADLSVPSIPASRLPPKPSLETAEATPSKGPSRVPLLAKPSRKHPTRLQYPNEDSADHHAPPYLRNYSTCVNLPLKDTADLQDLDIPHVISDQALSNGSLLCTTSSMTTPQKMISQTVKPEHDLHLFIDDHVDDQYCECNKDGSCDQTRFDGKVGKLTNMLKMITFPDGAERMKRNHQQKQNYMGR